MPGVPQLGTQQGWDLKAGRAEAGAPHLSASSQVESGMCCTDHSASSVTCYLLLATQGRAAFISLSPRSKPLWLEGTLEVIKSHLLPSAAGLLATFPMVFWLLLEHFLVTAEELFMKQSIFGYMLIHIPRVEQKLLSNNFCLLVIV